MEGIRFQEFHNSNSSEGQKWNYLSLYRSIRISMVFEFSLTLISDFFSLHYNITRTKTAHIH